MTSFYEYEKDPEAIYRQSFQRVGELLNPNIPRGTDYAELVTRIIHACGNPAVQDDIVSSPDFIHKALMSLSKGGNILCDCQMVDAGITRKFLPKDNLVMTSLNDGRVKELALALKTTRSAAATHLWKEYAQGSIMVFGNAPTALFQVMEWIREGKMVSPDAMIAFPVGFVGAKESKQALIDLKQSQDKALAQTEFITLQGTMGGSAMASAVVNALNLILMKGKGGKDG